MGERKRVLVSAPLPGRAVEQLAARHEVEVGDDPIGMGREAILARIAGFDALVALLSDRIDAQVLDAAPRLRVVANCAVGVDNVDLDACRARNVVVTNTPDVLTDATADMTMALLLAAARRVAEGDRFLRSGTTWRGWSPTELLGVAVSGGVLGIVGLGRIGQAVAKRARGFDMRVLYAQRNDAPADVARELGATRVPLDELVETSDFVCITCPLTPETRHLFDARRIARMKPDSVLVNTARGPIVDEEALADALERGRPFAAGLDVFEREPAVSNRLLASERVVVTPHAASADRRTRERMAGLCAEAVLDVLDGRTPRHRVV